MDCMCALPDQIGLPRAQMKILIHTVLLHTIHGRGHRQVQTWSSIHKMRVFPVPPSYSFSIIDTFNTLESSQVCGRSYTINSHSSYFLSRACLEFHRALSSQPSLCFSISMDVCYYSHFVLFVLKIVRKNVLGEILTNHYMQYNKKLKLSQTECAHPAQTVGPAR